MPKQALFRFFNLNRENQSGTPAQFSNQEFSVVSKAGQVHFGRLVKRSIGFSFLLGGAARTE
jgi:hypothetical protein